MPNIVEVSYGQTGESTTTNSQGMREMQVRAYNARDSQYLLLKAPPASGKSRALMFLALDKLYKQNIRKAIIAVPERSIGSSFSSKKLSEDGFFADWVVEPHNNLCTPGGDGSKVQAFIRFMEGEDRVIVCTHATLRFAFEAMQEEMFNDCLLAIDEFHHARQITATIKFARNELRSRERGTFTWVAMKTEQEMNPALAATNSTSTRVNAPAAAERRFRTPAPNMIPIPPITAMMTKNPSRLRRNCSPEDPLRTDRIPLGV